MWWPSYRIPWLFASVTDETERDADPAVISAGCSAAPSSIFPSRSRARTGSHSSAGSNERGVDGRETGSGRPFHACGVASFPLATAAVRQSRHPVGIIGAGRPDPSLMDGPDTKTTVTGGRGKVHFLLFQVCRNRGPFNVKDLDFIDGFLPFPDKFLNPVHCHPPPHREEGHEAPRH